MTKRIIIISTVLILTYCSIVIGKQFLLSHYRQKADVALFLSGDYKTAIKYYNKLIYWRPDAAGYYYNRGDAYKEDKQYENAIADYKKSLQLGVRDSLQAILRIALSAKRLGDLETEEQMLLRLLERSRDKTGTEIEFWASNYNLGKLEFEKRNYRRAINYYNAAHTVRPTELEIYHRANAYFALGQLDSAKQDLRQSLSFIKSDFLKKYPTSLLAACDSCYFPFGSKEYELLTESGNVTIIQALDKASADKQIKELNDALSQ
jgi:tetratricopeptide (TPR) repeat protein